MKTQVKTNELLNGGKIAVERDLKIVSDLNKAIEELERQKKERLLNIQAYMELNNVEKVVSNNELITYTKVAPKTTMTLDETKCQIELGMSLNDLKALISVAKVGKPTYQFKSKE